MTFPARTVYRFAAVLLLFVGISLIGCAPQPTGVKASDGSYADKIIVTWSPERVPEGLQPRTAYYKVSRAEDSEGPYDEMSGEIEGTSFIDESISPGSYYFYQVTGYNNFNMASDPSDYDMGYAGNTNSLFLQKVCNTELNALEKLNLKNPSIKIGTSATIEGDVSGTCRKIVSNHFLFWKRIEYIFSNYQDVEPKGVILNGTITTIVGLQSNGSCTGRLSVSGDYSGYMDYDLIVQTLQRTDGYYYISQDEGQEERFDWSPCTSDGGPTADIADQETAKAVLFAAYSGIAYEQESNILYGIMLGDVIGLSEEVANYVLDSMVKMDISELLPLGLKLLARRPVVIDIPHAPSGSLFSFAIDPGPASGDRTKDGKNYISFTATLSLDFNNSGYYVGDSTVNDRTYYGSAGTNDVVADLKGYFFLDINSLSIDILFTKVDVDLNNTLTISYSDPSEHDVSIDQWNVSFDIKYGVDDLNTPNDEPLNYKIVPKILPIPDYGIDNRDYTVNGSFTLDGEKTFTYNNMRYVQSQTGSDLFININGLLGVSTLGGMVLVETFDDITMEDGAWTSGSLPITGVSTSDAATFTSDGSVGFSGNLGTWSVENWQEDLNPF